MNRYSLMFAFLVASSFAVVPPQVGDHISSPGDTAATAKAGEKDKNGTSTRYGAAPPGRQAPVAFIQSFLAKAVTSQQPGETPTILFATVPHPLETHLGASFDHNLDAMQ